MFRCFLFPAVFFSVLQLVTAFHFQLYPSVYESVEVVERRVCNARRVLQSTREWWASLRGCTFAASSFFGNTTPPDAVEHYCRILLDGNLTKAEIRNTIAEQWTSEQDNGTMESYEKYAQEVEQLRGIGEQVRREYAEWLRGEPAKQLHKDLEAILADMNITIAEETQSIREVFQNSSRDARRQLWGLSGALGVVHYRHRHPLIPPPSMTGPYWHHRHGHFGGGHMRHHGGRWPNRRDFDDLRNALRVGCSRCRSRALVPLMRTCPFFFEDDPNEEVGDVPNRRRRPLMSAHHRFGLRGRNRSID